MIEVAEYPGREPSICRNAGRYSGRPPAVLASAVVCLKLTCSCQKIGTPASLARWLLAPFRFG